MSGHERRWNHNTHYYPLILAAVPDGCLRALDVGCGEGLLTRELAVRVPEVVGIDNDEPSIALAREQGPEGRAEYVLGDFLGYPFPAASFSLVNCVAALHHMDPAAALTRMAELLTPGGVLVVNGVARPAPRDLPLDLAAVVANLGYRAARGYWHHPSPVVWPPPHTYREIRALAEDLLPGVRYRRHLLWRYSLTWTRPAASEPSAGG